MNYSPRNPRDAAAEAQVDLSQLDDDFAQAEVAEPSSFDAVPDGKYQVSVERAYLTKAKSTGNPLLKWTLRILGPTHRDRLLWRNNVMATRDNLSWLKQDLQTCGVTLARLSDLPARVDELLDLKLEVTKRTKGEYENIYFNRVINVGDWPPDRQDQRDQPDLLDDPPF